jgi:hypothetical protein
MLRPNVLAFLKPCLAIVLCSSGVAAGFAVMLRDQARGGAVAAAPSMLPAAQRDLLDAHRPTLVVCAHPHCPCTRATLDELDRIAARCANDVRLHVLFSSAPDLGETWTRTDLWEQAARIPGVDVRADPSGAIACALGARTSGEVLLYSTNGRLLFHGGITSARGHAGDNAGEDAVVAIAHGREPAVTETAVFGCRLVGAEDAETGATP